MWRPHLSSRAEVTHLWWETKIPSGPCGVVRPFLKERGLPWGQGVSAFSIQATVGVNGKPEEGAEHHSIYLQKSGEMPRSHSHQQRWWKTFSTSRDVSRIGKWVA